MPYTFPGSYNSVLFFFFSFLLTPFTASSMELTTKERVILSSLLFSVYKANRLFSVFSSRSMRFRDGGGAGGMVGPPTGVGPGVGPEDAGGNRSAAATRSARNRSNSARGFPTLLDHSDMMEGILLSSTPPCALVHSLCEKVVTPMQLAEGGAE